MQAVTLTLDIADGWHIYGRDPGTSGLPTRLMWSLADGWSTVNTAWPSPRQVIAGRDTTYEYTGRVVIPMTLTRASASGRGVHRLEVSFGVCREVCIPERLRLDIAAPR